MAEALTILERILRRLTALVAATPGLEGAERWDARGNAEKPLVAVVACGDESSEVTSLSDQAGTRTNTVQVTVEVRLAPAGKSETVTDELVTRWRGRIKDAVLGTPGGWRIAEPAAEEGGTPVELGTVGYTGFAAVQTVEGQPEVMVVVGFEVVYEEWDSSSSEGPGIAAREDEED